MDNSQDRLDEDDFWCVALEPPSRHHNCDKSDDEATHDDSIEQIVRSYKLQLSKDTIITLRLASLPETDGIWSPLGAQAWHASALLAAYLTQNKDDLERLLQPKGNRTFLELGSGAVGLSGLALAMTVGRINNKISKVILTDLDSDGILENLQKNISTNQDTVKCACEAIGGRLPNIAVEELDWNSYIPKQECPDRSPQRLDNTSRSMGDDLRLITGSELIYTEETAKSCAWVIKTLLQQYPSSRVLIVQVLDRHGFHSHFVPMLQEAELSVSIEQPLDPQLFQHAHDILQDGTLGGTLDQLDYGACWITTKASEG